MEVKCRVCGGETIQKDGICRPCALFRKDEVAALVEKETAVEKIKTLRQTAVDVIARSKETKQSKGGIATPSARNDKTKTHGGEEMRKNKRCSRCKTEAHSNRAKKCHKCGEPFTKKVVAGSEEKKKRGRPSKAVIPATSGILQKDSESRSIGRITKNSDNIILKLLDVYHTKLSEAKEIRNVLETLKKYSGAAFVLPE